MDMNNEDNMTCDRSMQIRRRQEEKGMDSVKNSPCDPVFCHHLYEYEKGLRDLILHTIKPESLPYIKLKLKNREIDYEIQPTGNGNLNIFFGSDECVQIVRQMDKPSLSQHTPEEDFILGIMLGYSRQKQFTRYLKLKERQLKQNSAEVNRAS